MTAGPRLTGHSLLVATTVAIAVGSMTGCGPSPTAPTGMTNGIGALPPIPAAPTPGTQPTSRAALAISTFDLRFDRVVQSAQTGRDLYLYVPEIALHETRGLSAARLDNVFISVTGRITLVLTSAGCFSGPSGVVAAGGEWTSESIAYYCLDLDTMVDLAGLEAQLVVTYRDDAGSTGQATATTIVGSAVAAGGRR